MRKASEAPDDLTMPLGVVQRIAQRRAMRPALGLVGQYAVVPAGLDPLGTAI